MNIIDYWVAELWMLTRAIHAPRKWQLYISDEASESDGRKGCRAG